MFSSVLEAIGNTPLLRLEKLGKGLPGRVLLKLEKLKNHFKNYHFKSKLKSFFGKFSSKKKKKDKKDEK